MKIEKISDNQIRCTLTKSDLEHHQVKLSELAYGSEKAKRLFQEMMQQANREYGFDAENTPLMIEAIPISMESIILIITKVDDPEELDTRFSKFAPFKHGKSVPTLDLDGADDILDFFRKIQDPAEKGEALTKQSQIQQDARENEGINLVREYHFTSLDHAIAAAHGLKGFYKGENRLYKDKEDGYLLLICQSDCTPQVFNKVCNMLSEYAACRKSNLAAAAYYREHGDLIMDDAIDKLASLAIR
ncbi:MAG: adaptor protein MecA [Blautia sp.]|nr:adaptor protein MecA [Blautia sp.]